MDGTASGSKKRWCEESAELPESEPKRAKVRDLESVFPSEGRVINTASTLDLNANIDSPSCIEDIVHLGPRINKCIKPKGLGIDLNSRDVPSSVTDYAFHPYKDCERVKPQDALSECGSTRGLGGERDSMRLWKEMKQNGFLSSSNGGVSVPSIPKSRGRKKGNESMIKKKIEIAKKEQVDRFAKMAAPSGLLNELNPGIINHVRNQKQVHSIIENLVKSTKTKSKSGRSKQDVGKESCERKDLDNETFNPSHAYKTDEFRGHNDFVVSTANLDREEEGILALKRSSSATMPSTNMSSLSNEESDNISTVNSLSIKAASVASQWLELLRQDIKGRLAALRRSRKRVRAVIQTELPLLASQELGSNQENDHCVVRDSESVHFDKGTADLHRARWGARFDQMDNALSQEEKHLELSLNQIKEMLMHCEHGLVQFLPESGLQQRSSGCRLSKAETNPYLAVQAAAAAIYSTSNFLQSMENLPSL